MTFIVIPGVKGKVFKPEECFDFPKKHPCKNCYSCQLCSDDRCTLCRTSQTCGKEIRPSEDTKSGCPHKHSPSRAIISMGFTIKVLDCVIGRRRITTASSLWPCQNLYLKAQCRPSAATKSVFRLQVSGFRIRGLLTPEAYNPIPDESSGFTLTTHLRILRRSYDLRLYSRDAGWRLLGQMIPERSCSIPCGFFSMRRHRRAGRGAAQTGYPLFKRGVGREEVHEFPAGQRVDDQHMSR